MGNGFEKQDKAGFEITQSMIKFWKDSNDHINVCLEMSNLLCLCTPDNT